MKDRIYRGLEVCDSMASGKLYYSVYSSAGGRLKSGRALDSECLIPWESSQPEPLNVLGQGSSTLRSLQREVVRG